MLTMITMIIMFAMIIIIVDLFWLIKKIDFLSLIIQNMNRYGHEETKFDFPCIRCNHCTYIINFEDEFGFDIDNSPCPYCGKKQKDNWKCHKCSRGNKYDFVICEGCFSDRKPVVFEKMEYTSDSLKNNCLLNSFIKANEQHAIFPRNWFIHNAKDLLDKLISLGLQAKLSPKTMKELTSDQYVGDDAIIGISEMLNVGVILVRENNPVEITTFKNAKTITIGFVPGHYYFMF